MPQHIQQLGHLSAVDLRSWLGALPRGQCIKILERHDSRINHYIIVDTGNLTCIFCFFTKSRLVNEVFDFSQVLHGMICHNATTCSKHVNAIFLSGCSVKLLIFIFHARLVL